MRLISSFKDYYDVGLAYGIDPAIVYVREKKEIEDGSVPWHGTVLYRVIPSLNVDSVLVGFCGNTYLGMRLQFIDWDSHVLSDSGYLYDSSKVKEFIKSNCPKKIKKQIDKNLNQPDVWHREKFCYKNIASFLTINYFKTEIFEDWKVPIFTTSRDTRINSSKYITTLNDSLREFDFYRVFDSYGAMQELSMYYGTHLCINNPNIVEIDNESRIAKHGFDKKSFRK